MEFSSGQGLTIKEKQARLIGMHSEAVIRGGVRQANHQEFSGNVSQEFYNTVARSGNHSKKAPFRKQYSEGAIPGTGPYRMKELINSSNTLPYLPSNSFITFCNFALSAFVTE